MRFELDEDQKDLAALAQRFFTDALAEDRAAVLGRQTVPDAKVWTRLAAEAGFAAIAVPGEQDGADGTWLDLAVVIEAAGRAVSAQPLLVTAGAAVAALRTAGPGAHPMLAAIAAGESTATWVDVARPVEGLTASIQDGEWSVTGKRMHVPHADTVGVFVLAARTADGLGLFTVEPSHASVTSEQPLDPSRSLGTLVLEKARATVLTTDLDEADLLRAQAVTRVLMAAEQIGVGQGILDLAVEHALTRHQFGRPIGGFQSIKHLLADAYAEVDSARVVARYAAWALSADSDTRIDYADSGAGTDDQVTLAALTVAHVSPAVQRAAGIALQVLGGIGYTWEHPAHLYYKRAISSARLFGSADAHLDQIAKTLISAVPPLGLSAAGRTLA